MIKDYMFSLQRLKTRQGYLLSLLLLNTVLKNLVSVVGEEKEKKAYELDREKKNCLYSQMT